MTDLIFTTSLDFQTLGGRECGRRWEIFEVAERPEGAGSKRETWVQELRLQMVQDVCWQAAVGFHVTKAETCWVEWSVQVLRGVGHGELEESIVIS